jgi:hypothetical protein
MPNSIRNLILGSMILCSAPVASQSAEFCGVISQLEQLSQGGFSSIKGQSNGRRSYMTTFNLPGADECYIYENKDGEDAYWCIWNSGSKANRHDYIVLAQAIAKCFPAASENIDPESDTHPTALITTRRAKFYVSAEKEDGSVNLSVNAR